MDACCYDPRFVDYVVRLCRLIRLGYELLYVSMHGHAWRCYDYLIASFPRLNWIVEYCQIFNSFWIE